MSHIHMEALAAQINWPKNIIKKKKGEKAKATDSSRHTATTINVVHFAYTAIMLKYSGRNAMRGMRTGERYDDCQMTCIRVWQDNGMDVAIIKELHIMKE